MLLSSTPDSSGPSAKPTILHLGTAIYLNPEIHARLLDQFNIINPPLSELSRPNFLRHLREKTWGDFSAIIRPFWNTGGEMGRWDRELIKLLPESVKVYASAGAGFDWIDTACLADYGILYCNGKGVSTEAVADMALWHIISVFRNMTWSCLAARSGDSLEWLDAHHNAPGTAHNPKGHTLGIIGLGDIGHSIALKAHLALGMRILYHDLVRKPTAQEEELKAEFYKGLGPMLAASDCVVLATPFAGEKIITRESLKLFKEGSRLVNIARGSLIDEDALATALEEGKLAAVGLDVHANEPEIAERFIKLRNVTLTCHTGGGTLESIIGFERLAMENVERVLNGEAALTGVNGHLIRTERKNTASRDDDGEGLLLGTSIVA